MKIKFVLAFIIGLLSTNVVFGQNQEKYSELIKEAGSLYESEDFKESAEKYKAAFDQFDGRACPNDRYNAACSYALAGDIENAFYHLNRLADNPNIKYKDLGHLTSDGDLAGLHKDDRWVELLEKVKANKEDYEKDFNKPLVATLDSILQLDQGNRRKLREMWAKHGPDSEEAKAQGRLTYQTDSINVIKVTRILDEYGWLGPEVVGNRGSNALFLVIQHAEIETQEKYLPMLKQAAMDGKAEPGMLAYLQDRIAIRKGERQIYGSQLGKDPETGESYVMPLTDPEHVNERRAEVGLGTIEEYISSKYITWDLEKHKERTKKIESENRK